MVCFDRVFPCGRLRALSALVLLTLLFFTAACDDPTGVGGELIDRGDTGPNRVILPLEVDTVNYAPTTGAASQINVRVSRFLAGQTTNDPLGDVTAQGYFDFGRANAPGDIEALTIDTVEVELRPAAFYGDTTQAAELALYDMTDEWEASGADADTSLSGTVEPSPITTFSVQPSDSVVTVQLPDSWIREHDSEIKAETDSLFADRFHGFQVRNAGGSSVVSFTASATTMRATFDDDASDVSFGLTQNLTTIQQPDPQQVEDRYVIQDGTGRALAFAFDFPDSLRNASVNNATLVLEADTTLEETPPNFARPSLETLDLYGIPTENPEGGPRLLQRRGLTLNADASRFENNFPLNSLVQDFLLGTSEVERFQIRPPLQVAQTNFGNVPVSVPSLNSTLIRRDPEHQPRLVLTYTPTDE